jgi:hypothetical protein
MAFVWLRDTLCYAYLFIEAIAFDAFYVIEYTVKSQGLFVFRFVGGRLPFDAFIIIECTA